MFQESEEESSDDQHEETNDQPPQEDTESRKEQNISPTKVPSNNEVRPTGYCEFHF